MALYPCPECKREISTDAKACPHCGKNVQFAGAGARWKALPKSGKIFIIFAVLVFLFAIWAESLPKPQTTAPTAQPSVASAPAPAADGSMTIQPGTWFGFRTREAMDKATKLATQGDKDAWSTFMAQAMMNRQIVELKTGEKVFLEETALMSGMAKVRRKGEVGGWWTNMEAVK